MGLVYGGGETEVRCRSVPACPELDDGLPPVGSRCFLWLSASAVLMANATRSFLNNAQSAADSANFMANVKFPGIDEDLTAPNHPWIYYGVRWREVVVLTDETHLTLDIGLIRRCSRCSHESSLPRPGLGRCCFERCVEGHLRRHTDLND